MLITLGVGNLIQENLIQRFEMNRYIFENELGRYIILSENSNDFSFYKYTYI